WPLRGGLAPWPADELFRFAGGSLRLGEGPPNWLGQVLHEGTTLSVLNGELPGASPHLAYGPWFDAWREPDPLFSIESEGATFYSDTLSGAGGFAGESSAWRVPYARDHFHLVQPYVLSRRPATLDVVASFDPSLFSTFVPWLRRMRVDGAGRTDSLDVGP